MENKSSKSTYKAQLSRYVKIRHYVAILGYSFLYEYHKCGLIIFIEEGGGDRHFRWYSRTRAPHREIEIYKRNLKKK